MPGVPLKFSVYAKKQDRLVRLFEINRTPTGLYFNDVRGSSPSYVTYHEDGAYWVRVRRIKAVKKRREPLASLTGAYTLSTMLANIYAPMPNDRRADDAQIRTEDIVVEYPGNFGVEVILSDKEIELEPLP